MEGWIKAHRIMLDNPVVCKDSDYLAVWMYLLLNATHKEYPSIFGGEKIILQPGQLITGRKAIGEKFKISESKVERILKLFKSEQQIEQQTSNKNRLISIVNWEIYQSTEQQDEQQVNNNRTTTEQQVNTNKNVKNIENVKKEERPLVDSNECDIAFEKFYNSYPKMGSVRKKAFESFKKHWKEKKITTENIDGVIRSACSYVSYQKHNGLNTCGAQVFLNQERWNDIWVIAEKNTIFTKEKTRLDEQPDYEAAEPPVLM